MKLHSYQEEAVRFMLSNPCCALFADPGLGKTVMTLTALTGLAAIQEVRAIIVAPLFPMKATWPSEIELWEHTRHLRYQVHHGPKKDAKLDFDNHEIVLVTPEGLPKFLEHSEAAKANILVIDESTRFKNWSSARMKALKKKLGQFERRHILTGTPAPNSLLDLFSQMFIVDRGESLGKYYTHFRRQYFQPKNQIQIGGRMVTTNWEPNPGAEKAIGAAMAPRCMRLDGEKLLDLPDFVYSDITVDLPKLAKKHYDRLQKELFTQLDSGEPISAASAGSAYGMCRQAAGGTVYAETPSGVVELHEAKLDALRSLVEELSGKPVMVAFNFRHERERLLKLFPDAETLDGQTPDSAGPGIIERWNAGKIRVLLAHPQSVGHGVNLQKGPGRHIVWFTLTDNMENYEQLNRRIRRQGVTSRVFVYHLLARGTVDLAVLRAVRRKVGEQQNLLETLKQWRDEHGK